VPFLVAKFLCVAADDWPRAGKRAMGKRANVYLWIPSAVGWAATIREWEPISIPWGTSELISNPEVNPTRELSTHAAQILSVS
jgi:hypothetical protein